MSVDETIERLAREIREEPLNPIALAKLWHLLERVPGFDCKQVYIVVLLMQDETQLEAYNSEFFAKKATLNTMTDILYNVESLPARFENRYDRLVNAIISEEDPIKIIASFNKFWHDVGAVIKIRFEKLDINP